MTAFSPESPLPYRLAFARLIVTCYLLLFLTTKFSHVLSEGLVSTIGSALQAVVICSGVLLTPILIVKQRFGILSLLAVLMFSLMFIGRLVEGSPTPGLVVATSTVVVIRYVAQPLDLKLAVTLLYLPIGTLLLSILLWPVLSGRYFRGQWTSLYFGEFPFFMGITGHPNHVAYLMVFGLALLWSLSFSKKISLTLTPIFLSAVIFSGSDGAFAVLVGLVALMLAVNDFPRNRGTFRSWRTIAAVLIVFGFTVWNGWLLTQQTFSTFTSGRDTNVRNWITAEEITSQEVSSDPHLAWLSVLDAGGFPALLIAVIYFALALYSLGRSRRTKTRRLGIALIWILISASVVESFWASGGLTMPTVMFSLLGSIADSARQSRWPPKTWRQE